MARLTRETIQRLAVLRALALWHNGPFGKCRLHRTLFLADKSNPRKRLFTFRKYRLGPHSPDVSNALNALSKSSRIECVFEGPAERLKAAVSRSAISTIKHVLARRFPQWEAGLIQAFSESGHLPDEDILQEVRDPTYAQSDFDQVIFQSALPAMVGIPGLDAQTAERLTDLVDERLNTALKDQFLRTLKAASARKDVVPWRKAYFNKVEHPPEKNAV